MTCVPLTGTSNHNYDLSGSDLRRLYNSPVYKAERMKRPLEGTGFVLGPISHSGVRSVCSTCGSDPGPDPSQVEDDSVEVFCPYITRLIANCC